MATLTSIKALITALRQATARRSVSPENVGYIMQLLAEHIGDSESAQQLLRDGAQLRPPQSPEHGHGVDAPEGELLDEFYVGIIPGAFCWK